MKNLYSLIFGLFAFFNLSFAEPGDSLKTVLAQADNDFQKINTLIDLVNFYQGVDIEQALPFAKKAVILSEKLNDKSKIGKSYIALGRTYANLGTPDTAQIYFEKALESYKQANDKRGIAAAYDKFVYILIYIKGNYESAAEYSFKALKIYEELEDIGGIIGTCNDLASNFQEQSKLEESNKWARKALKLAEENEHPKEIEMALSTLGYNFLEDGKTPEKAIPIYKRVVKMSEEEGNLVSMAINYNDLGNAYKVNKQYDRALEFYDKGIKTTKEANFLPLLPSLIYCIGHVQSFRGNYSEAVKNMEYSHLLAEQYGGQGSNEIEYYRELSKAYVGLGDYKKGLELFQKFTEVKDSMFNEKTETIISELNTKYEIEQKEKEISILSEKEKTQTAQITAARNRNLLLLGLVGMLLLGGGTVYYRRQLNEQLRLQSIRSQISSDLHDEVGSSLAQLSMIMGSVEGTDPASAKSYLQKGNEILSSSISKIRDVVWAIDAKNDGTGALLDRMEDFAYDMLSAKSIQYKINNKGFNRNENLPPLIRQNFYLFYKEAITNIYKHSDATNVQIDFSRKGKNIYIKIADNGKGVNDKKVSGSGIENMKLRAKKIGGHFELDERSEGFTVRLESIVE